MRYVQTVQFVELETMDDLIDYMEQGTNQFGFKIYKTPPMHAHTGCHIYSVSSSGEITLIRTNYDASDCR